MRIIRLLLAVVLFIPITSFAEENQFIERQYILGNHNPEPYDNLEEGCEWAAPYVPSAIVGGGTSELRVIMTQKEDGKIRKEGDTVGELWLCVGDVTERDNPALGLQPERVIAFYMNIDGMEYGGLGTWSPKTEWGFPEMGMAVWSGGAILVHLVDGVPGDTAGAMTYNILDNVYGIRGYDSGAAGLVFSIRLFEERNFDREKAIKALEEVF